MDKPTPQLLSLLTPMERLAFRVGNLFAGPLRWFSTLWCATFLRFVAWFTACRRFRVSGAEHLADLGPRDRVLMVANHRSFFDYFAITWAWYNHSRLTKKAFYPVRGNFFYETPLGLLINLTMSGMTMFPPVLRQRRKIMFNKYAMERTAAELRRPGTVVGMHPEGTRNKSDDPYHFLAARPGVGKVALEVDGLTVIPVYIHGMRNALHVEIWRNWTNPKAWPLHIRFGEAIDLTDLRQPPIATTAAKAASERFMAVIADLADEVRTAEPDAPAAEHANAS